MQQPLRLQLVELKVKAVVAAVVAAVMAVTEVDVEGLLLVRSLPHLLVLPLELGSHLMSLSMVQVTTLICLLAVTSCLRFGQALLQVRGSRETWHRLCMILPW